MKQLTFIYKKEQPTYCGRWAWSQLSPYNEKTYYPFWCNSLKCSICSPYGARRIRKRIEYILDSGQMVQFVTVTIDPDKADNDRNQYTTHGQYAKIVMNRFLVYIRREGISQQIKYFWVLEFHNQKKEVHKNSKRNNPYPHFHILFDIVHDYDILWSCWNQARGGWNVDEVEIDSSENVAAYMCKYMAKDGENTAQLLLQERSRLWGSSRGLDFGIDNEPKSDMILIRENVFNAEGEFQWQSTIRKEKLGNSMQAHF